MSRDEFLLIDTPGDLKTPNIGLGLLVSKLKSLDIQVSVISPPNHVEWPHFVFDVAKSRRPKFLGFSIHCTTVRHALQWVSDFGHFLSTDTAIVFGGPQAENELSDPSFAQSFGIEYRSVVLESLILVQAGSCYFPEVYICLETGYDYSSIPNYLDWNREEFLDYPLLASSGCPNACPFCGLAESKWQARDDNSIAEELQYFPKVFGSSCLTIWDSNFMYSKDHAYSAIKQIAYLTQLPWRANGVCLKDCSDLDFLKELVNLGCYGLYFGIERISKGYLYEKGGTKLSVAEANNILQQLQHLNIVSIGSFICGLPGETARSTYRCFDVAAGLMLDYQVWAHVIPMPNTPLLQYIKNNGRQIIDYRLCSYQHSCVAFDTPEFTLSERSKAIRFMRSKLYANKAEFDNKRQIAQDRARAILQKMTI